MLVRLGVALAMLLVGMTVGYFAGKRQTFDRHEVYENGYAEGRASVQK